MLIRDIDIKGKIVLAPLAGYTNKVYRKIAKEMGASLVYSEMVSSKGLIYENKKTFEMIDVTHDESPVSLQLFGGDVDEMIEAAKIVDKESDCDIIDINMGCPVKKVLKANSGSCLLLDVKKIEDMVRGVVNAVSKPVSVKIRAGWDHSSINVVEVAQAIERAGASVIAVHGRTKSDLYRGHVNLDYIKMAKDAVTIPVIGNGDIKSVKDAVKMLEYTGCDAIMIGRGTFGNPWLIKEIHAHLNNEEFTPPTKEEKVEMMLRHFNELVELKGEKVAILEMRSQAAWYVKGLENTKEFKQKLVYITTKEEFYNLVKLYIME
ncbi:MAG: tRNA dihydrouridine synthase DusB [Bacilli bacterium]